MTARRARALRQPWAVVVFSLAHEINNPLGGLLNPADTIVTYADRLQVVRELGNLMLRGLTHLRDVTRAVLDQNRLDRSGQPRWRPDVAVTEVSIGRDRLSPSGQVACAVEVPTQWLQAVFWKQLARTSGPATVLLIRSYRNTIILS